MDMVPGKPTCSDVTTIDTDENNQKEICMRSRIDVRSKTVLVLVATSKRWCKMDDRR